MKAELRKNLFDIINNSNLSQEEKNECYTALSPASNPLVDEKDKRIKELEEGLKQMLGWANIIAVEPQKAFINNLIKTKVLNYKKIIEETPQQIKDHVSAEMDKLEMLENRSFRCRDEDNGKERCTNRCKERMSGVLLTSPKDKPNNMNYLEFLLNSFVFL